MSFRGLRSAVLRLAGSSWPARVWARRRCRVYGVSVQKSGGEIELRRGDRAILLLTKHVFFAPAIASAFDAYAGCLPWVERTGLKMVNFAAEPDAFNLCRRCLSYGVTIENKGDEVWLKKDVRAMVLAARHFIYSGDMAEKFELYFSPLVPEERDGWLVLDYSQPGRLQTYARSGLQFEMASFPEEEDAIEEYFRWYRPKPGDLVFDMGAHCGVSTYYLSQLVGPEGRVVSFEPDPVNNALLMRNVVRHNLRNVTVESAAIGGRAGKLGFNSEGTIGSSLVSLLHRKSVGSVVTVDVVTLAEVFGRWGVPAFCKIDIEGAEVDVIASSAELLTRHRTNFAIDTNHPKANGAMTNGEIEKLFQSYGYEVFSEANPLLTTWARPRGTNPGGG